VVTAQWPYMGSNWAYVRPCTTTGKIFKKKAVSRVRIESTLCVCVFVCVFVCLCVCQSSLQLLCSTKASQVLFSGNISGIHPVWNFFGLPATMMDVGRVFPQSVHMNIGVVFE
jgi:hypothetical protein